MAAAKTIKEGTNAPTFCLEDQDNNKVCLKDYKGKWIVLYFYPKDNTSGCTREAVEFTNDLKKFEKLNAAILGVSPDSVKSHTNFCNKHNLTITLLSDPEHSVLEKYAVWQIKKMYGREYYGVVRSTFLIDPAGKIAKSWIKVKVDGHAAEVLDTIKGQ